MKEADKGGAVVIMNTDHFVNKKVTSELDNLCQTYKNEPIESEIKNLTKLQFKTSNFYGLTKIYKS